MLTLRTGNYKKEDFLIMLNALHSARAALNCNMPCTNCFNYRVCSDLIRLENFVNEEYNKACNKGNT